MGKESACNEGDAGSVPESGIHAGGGNGNPLQCSCLENPMGRGARRAAFHSFAKSQTWLKRLSMHACVSTCNKNLDPFFLQCVCK